MDRRRLTGLIALIALLLLIGVLTWYDATRRGEETTTAFAPAKSTDESVAPPETPIVPPASMSAGQPATPPPAAEAAAPVAQPAPASSDVAAAPPAAPPQPAAPPPPAAAGAEVAAAPPVTAPEPPTPQPPPVAAAPEPPPAQPPAAAEASPEPAPAQPPAAVATAEPPPAQPVPPPDAGAPAVMPTFDIVRVDPTGETVVAGLAEPHAKVEILDGTQPVATAEANERGEWAMALDKALPPGTHDLSVRTTSKNRSIAALSDQRVAVQVPEAGSKDVLVVLNSPTGASKVIQVPPASDKPPAAVAAAEPAAPKQTEPPAAAEPQIAAEPPIKAEPQIKGEPPVASEPQVAAIPPAAEPAPPPAPTTPPPPQPAVSVQAVEADTAGDLFIAGTAVTSDAIRVYFQDEMIGEAMPSPSGTWLVQIHREVPPGTYRIRADQIAAADGKVIARAEVPFEREINVAALKATGSTGASAGTAVAGKMPEVETVIIKRGDNLWRVARAAWGKGIRWSNIYQANRDQIRNPRRIYPGQVFMMPKVQGKAKN